ncbi:MAG TPA: dihydrodipicolinate synthase family protein [Terriglobales bacterium]|nr:dihydrodipicolinate synthase family protein [Terriglobales bacterium]
MLLHGIFPPITTPFYPDGNLYYKKLEANVERYSKTPVAGIVVLGSTGEAIMLSDQERLDVLKVAREATGPSKVLVAGTGVESAIETLKLSEYAAELGYDVAMVRTPHYHKKQMQPANMLAFYRFVADRSPLPVIIYNIPQCTAYDIPAEVVIELADHPNLIGIKESSGDVEKVRKMVEGTGHVRRNATATETFNAVTPRMLKASTGNGGELIPIAALAGGSDSTVEDGRPRPSRPATGIHQAASSSAVTIIEGLKTRQKEVGFQVLVGAAHKLKDSLDAGAVGAILAFACPAPTACFEIYTAWKEGDHELAGIKQERIANASQRVVGEFGIPGVKYAMDFNGYYGGPARLPLLPPTAEMKTEVERLMTGIRN